MYAHENGCPWNESICENAAILGNLDCLKYARENGCPWNAQACLAKTKSKECREYILENITGPKQYDTSMDTKSDDDECTVCYENKNKVHVTILERLISTTELFSMDIVLNIHFQPKMFEVAFRRDREMYYDTLKRLDVYRIPNVNCARPYRFMFVEYYDTILNEAIVKDITHYPVNIPPVGVYTPRFGYIPIHVS